MSEDTAATTESSDGGNSGATPPATQPEFTPITSQDELNKALAARLERERAKFADYSAIKAKAARLDTIEEANKTEAQKLTEQAAAAQAEAESAKADLLRYRVAAKHGITEQDAVDFILTGKDEETLERQAAIYLRDRADPSKPRSPRPDPNQGRGGTPATGAPRDQFGAWLNAT